MGMAAGVIVEDRVWLGRLDRELRGVLAPVFAQARSRLTAFSYIGALLSERGDRKSCWQLAEEAGHATPRRMQALLGEYAWDWQAALAALQRFIVARLGDPGAILALDENLRAVGPDLALLPPAHRAVHVRPGAAGRRRRPPGPA
jgi:hypothetical protein